MSELLKQGLQISAIGMGLTFAALVLLILVMVLLERIFRPRDTAAGSEPVEPTRAATLTPPPPAEEMAIAAAAAVAYLRRREQAAGQLGDLLDHGRGAWWRAGQTRLASRPAQKNRQRRRQ